MEAIILAGGFGTRLKHIVSDVPKPMASIDDRGTPFLSILLDKLFQYGFEKIILSTGYMHNKIEEYFGDSYRGVRLIYSEEKTPLLTGGAIKKALSCCDEENVFVLNGDTYFDVDFSQMKREFEESKADVSIAVKEMKDFDRYGTVVLEGKQVCAFREKEQQSAGWINGGIYCLRRDLLNEAEDKFSFEKHLEIYVRKLDIIAYLSDGFFIDIGIPEDYFQARDRYADSGFA
ncbi:nucleotidyl transferase [Selenomonas sp. oral taxon 892 str. F0426]|jgi:putative D-glycero-D-manno-heptose 1-phosphate guanosyltransferase|uniref:nucleotidyltransferase family protein n=1 Tax=Selenomonas sp. oral taxon 892 TaxID=1321785 RepID=UPI0003ACEBF4|nr:nucleotidyltransferase family protein [Selenomonas sp. oral taxon 892]ERJ95885.1 nucleotidyl transferase [Selenomonas sp. oral taxon 892 str. F0426]